MYMFDLVTRYRDGQRDFRGADLRGARLGNADLRGIDLSGADLRGADFSGAKLEGAKLSGVRCGAVRRWGFLRALLGLAAGGFSSLMMVLAAVLWAVISADPDLNKIPLWFSQILLILAIMGLGLWIWRGRLDGAVAFVVASALAFVTIASSNFISTSITIFMSFAGIVAVAVAVAVAIAVAVAFPFAATGAGAAAAVAFALAFALNTEKSGRHRGVFLIAAEMLVIQCIALWLLRRRALAGDLEHAWARDFAIASRGQGGTRFYLADLGMADFCASDLHGVDLRGAVLDGVCFRDVLGLDWARFDAGDLRKLPVQRLLMSGVGTGQDISGIRFSGVSLRKADLSGARLRQADLRGVDLSEASLDNAILEGARIDAQTYVRSGWTPRMLDALHKRGVEVVALEAFPPAAQDVVVGLRDGLVLSFRHPLTHFRQHLIEGSLYSIVGIESACRIGEYREKDDGTSFVRIVGANRAELERVAEAFYRRVWEETKTSSSRELSRVNELLGDALRQKLSELVRDLVEMELRQPVVTPTQSTALIKQGQGSAAASEPIWRWEQSIGRVTFFGQHPRRAVIVYAPSEIDTALCQELLKHMEGLRGQGLIETFHAATPGEAVAETFATEISSADMVLVLYSSDLLANAACQARLNAALRAEQAARKLLAVPVVVRPCDWQSSPIGKRQCMPESGRPVTSWGTSTAERDAGWVEVISALRRHLLSLSTAR